MEGTEPIKSTEETPAESGQSSHKNLNCKSLKEADKRLVPVSPPEGATRAADGVTECSGIEKSASKPRGVEEDGLKDRKLDDKHTEEAVCNHHGGVNKDANRSQSSNCEKIFTETSTLHFDKEQYIDASVKSFFKIYTYDHLHSQSTDYKKYEPETNTIKNQNIDNSICKEFLEGSGETDHEYLHLKDTESYDHEIHVYPCSTSDPNEASNTRDVPSVTDTHDTSDASDLNDNVISLHEERITNNVNVAVDTLQPRRGIIDLSQQNRLLSMVDLRAARRSYNTNIGHGPNREFSSHRHRAAIFNLRRGSCHGQGRVIVDLRAAAGRNIGLIQRGPTVNLHPRFCMLCLNPCAQVWCATCDDYFCPACDQQHHSTMGRQGHQRTCI